MFSARPLNANRPWENLAYRCDLLAGITREALCPFHYFGVPDLVDYRDIPWRNGRFDPDALEAALAVRARRQRAGPIPSRRGDAHAGLLLQPASRRLVSPSAAQAIGKFAPAGLNCVVAAALAVLIGRPAKSAPQGGRA